MRNVTVHPEKSIQFTNYAKTWCTILNTYRRFYPDCTFKQMSKVFNLSETNTRRYYYGMHHLNHYPVAYNQMRQGACVTI